MNILRFDDENKLHEAGAGIISGIVQTKPNAVLGLATGGTPIGIYERLVHAYERGMISFKDISTFNLDEYVGLSPEHKQSYSSYMREHLFDRVDINLERTHIPNGIADDLEAECARYDQLIQQAGQFDIQLLGLGHNGHIGFNEPSNALVKGTHVVELAASTIAANARYFDSIEEVSSRALTMGVGTILQAKMILLVVKGEEKAKAVRNALQGPIHTECPASLLQTHPHLVVLLDQAAGSLLK